jgi:hypothetical protein
MIGDQDDCQSGILLLGKMKYLPQDERVSFAEKDRFQGTRFF